MMTSLEHKRFQHSVAMTVTLVSFGMLFAAMFLGYFLVRFNTPVWPPVEIQGMPTLLPLLSTVVIALSSLSFHWYQTTQKRLGLWGAVLLGVVFLACQWQLWAALKMSGILVANGQVSSMVYAFTWLHAAHIALGMLGLLWLVVTPFGEFKTLNVGKFWHFLGAVWLIMYLMLFLV